MLYFCIGTRPEAIKLAPLVLAARLRGYDARILSTGQHREMMDPIFTFFGLKPDVDLHVLVPGQSLPDLTATVLSKVAKVFEQDRPAMVFVQGDTTTALGSAFAAFYGKIPVAHIEAGLRTHDPYSPFPEEMNRSVIGRLATYHFAPTESSKENLAREGITRNVWVTGNTGIDALRITSDILETQKPTAVKPGQKTILVTCHRRETHGAPLLEICDAILEIVQKHPDVNVVFPVHLNPNVKTVVHQKLGSQARVELMEPVNYPEFSKLMKDSFILLTDSGGIQEEGPYFKKPIFVMRDSTERPEGVTAKVAELVGSDRKTIVERVSRALIDDAYYQSFRHSENPYGDGFACERILDFLAPFLKA